MVKRRIILALCILILPLFLSFITAEATIIHPYNITSSCSGFTCANLNATVFYPNSTIFVDNKAMTSNGVYAYYQLTPSAIGQYNYILYDGGNYSNGSFTATGTGSSLDTPKTFVYLGLLALLVFLFLLSVSGFGFLKGGNKRNEMGDIISMNYFKYLKSTLFVLAWGFLIMIFYISSSLTANYFVENVSSIFFMLFRLSLILSVPMVIFYGLWVIVNAFNDKKIKQAMDRGVLYGQK